MPTLIYPKSRGEVRLASTDPTEAPLIDPRYLEDGDDVRFLLEGVQLDARDHGDGAGSPGVVHGRAPPGAGLRRRGRARARAAGPRPHRLPPGRHLPDGRRTTRAVVDPQLRVRGIDGLRVADASIMPSVTGGNTNAPCMMIGERCAELVRAAS